VLIRQNGPGRAILTKKGKRIIKMPIQGFEPNDLRLLRFVWNRLSRRTQFWIYWRVRWSVFKIDIQKLVKRFKLIGGSKK
jgi:hypothetical protein